MPGLPIDGAAVPKRPLTRLFASSPDKGMPGRTPDAKSSVRRRTLAFAAIQILVIWAIAIGFIWAAYNEDIETGEQDARSSSLTVAAYTRQVLGSADLVLGSAQDWVSQSNINSERQFRQAAAQAQFAATLKDRIVAMPHISFVVIASADGDVVNSTVVPDNGPSNIAGREAFRTLIASDAPDLALTAVALSPMGRWTFYMSRRLTAKSGELLGVVIVGIDAESLSSLFRQIAPVGEEVITLFRPDGALLATTVADSSLFGKRYPDAAPLRMIRQGLGGTVQRTDEPRWSDPSSRESRLVAPRAVEGFPVVVAASIGHGIYLAAFDREVVLSLAIALALTILTIFITRRFLQLLALTEAAGQLTAQRRLFAALIDTPSALCAVLDRDGRILYSNGRFDQVLKDAVASPNVFEHDSVRGGGEVLRFASSSERDSIELDLRLENDAARPRYLRFSLSRQALPGLGNCTVMVGHDETARHEVQQSLAQSAKLATLGELTTGIAHEITQPLNVMRMAAQNALMEVEAAEEAPEGASAEAQKDFRAFISGKLNRIVSQVDRAADIVSRMRIFGRAPKGPPIEFDVRDACRAALSMIEGRAKSADVTIVTELGEQPLNVRGHRNLIEMVMINLLLNARDALESSTKPRRTITVSATRAETGRVRLIVADNGPGVPASIRDRIFEPFFTGKPTGKGVGLGLATSYGIIHDAGGSLSLLQGDDGATFQIELPAASD